MATVLISIAVARSSSTVEFGIFSIVVAIWIITVGSIRAVTGELLVYGHSHTMGENYTEQKLGAQASAWFLGLVAAASIAAVGAFFPNFSLPLMLVAIGIPAFVAQDNNRFILSTQGRQKLGLIVDIIYIMALVVGLFTPIAPTSFLGLISVWVGTAWAAALFGSAITGFAISPRRAWLWLTGQKHTVWMYFSDFFVANTVANSAVFIVALSSGADASAAIRGAQVLLVPILLVMRGASVALGPQLARYAHHGPQKSVLTITMALTAAQFVAILVSWLAIIALPAKYIQAILGDSSDITVSLFPFAAAATLALGSATVAMLALKAAGRVVWSVRLKIWTAPVTLLLIFIGSTHWSAPGSQIALAAGELFRTVLEWLVLTYWYRSTKKSPVENGSRRSKNTIMEVK